MGPQKAIHAVGNLILRLCYHILVSGIKYEEREKEDYEKFSDCSQFLRKYVVAKEFINSDSR